MLRNHKLAKAISDVSWAEFFRMLEYKAKLYGCDLVKVDTFYPSSQTCSCCGYQNKATNNLGIRKWTCSHIYNNNSKIYCGQISYPLGICYGLVLSISWENVKIIR